jgi:aspartyl-tRNA(Asn)/glutamyl-tRNA(Gln) amidotransferase subunit B
MDMANAYQAVIGLEVHVQLNTRTKAFCGCTTEFGKEPNSQVCPVCLGFPGVLPVLNKVAFEYAIRVGIALHCAIQGYTKFDRKNYFYPDLPKNFQISQYDLPIALNGCLDIAIDGREKRIVIKRVHLEEDAGKLIHGEDSSLVDFNRAGIPLLEIVSEPEMNSPEEAYTYLTDLKSIVQYLEVSECDMEKGTLRCDANVSIRPKGASALGTKTEVKNLNSFKAVKDALHYEIERHKELLGQGGKVIQETRLWDSEKMRTVSMRSKEEAKDYRYFPEPDLPPFMITVSQIEENKKCIPELPKEKKARFIKEYALSSYDAGILVLHRKDADFAESALKLYAPSDKKAVANWLIGPLLSHANAKNTALCGLGISAQDLVTLVNFVSAQQISHLAAKAVLEEMVVSQKPPEAIIKEKNLMQISDSESLAAAVEAVLNEHAKSVQNFKAGNDNAVMFLIGQVMKRTNGKANPKVVQEMLRRRLTNA